MKLLMINYAKMRIFKFWNEAVKKKRKSNEFEEGIMSVQGDFKDNVIELNLSVKK